MIDILPYVKLAVNLRLLTLLFLSSLLNEKEGNCRRGVYFYAWISQFFI